MILGRTLEECKVLVYWLWAIAALAGTIAIAASVMSNWLLDQIANKTEAMAKSEIDRAHTRIENLASRRALTGDQIEAIRAGIRAHAGEIDSVTVGSVADGESQDYARQILKLLRDEHVRLGNDRDGVGGPFIVVQTDRSDYDMAVAYRTDSGSEKAEKDARLLHGILEKAGLKPLIGPTDDKSVANVNIFIMPKLDR